MSNKFQYIINSGLPHFIMSWKGQKVVVDRDSMTMSGQIKVRKGNRKFRVDISELY